MQEQNRIRTRYAISLYAGSMLLCICMNLTGTVLPEIMADYQLHLDRGGWMSCFQNIGGVTAILILSRIMDRMRKPIVQAAAFLTAALMLFVIGGFPPFVLFLVCYMVMGACLSTLDSAGNAILADIYDDKRDMALCIIHGVSGVGAVLIPIISVIAGTGNWGVMYRGVALVICVIALIQLALYLSGKRVMDAMADAHAVEVKADAGRGGSFFADRRVLAAIISIFGFGVCQSGITVWSIKFCKDVLPQAGALLAALTLSAYWIGTTISRLAVGLVPALARVKSRTLILYGGILAGVALFVGVISGNYPGLFLGILIFGFLNGATLPKVVGLMTGWHPERSGLAASTSFVALYIGFVITPLIMGIVADAAGMVTMMMIPVAGTVLSGLMGIFLPRGE